MTVLSSKGTILAGIVFTVSKATMLYFTFSVDMSNWIHGHRLVMLTRCAAFVPS